MDDTFGKQDDESTKMKNAYKYSEYVNKNENVIHFHNKLKQIEEQRKEE